MSTLYRKYRPGKFSEVVGQNHVRVTLENEIAGDKVAHAYLFCGPRAVGKTTFARILAKSVNCLNRKEGEADPCGQCDSCREIGAGNSFDIVEIDAASHTGVDNVRENIISSARIAPAKRKYKVFIIDEVHMLSISAFNALLKVLEEPPADVIFILCTTEAHKVPSTIISRCQRFDFRRISIEDMVKKMRHITDEEGIKINDKILEMISRQADGHMRDAESLLGQITAIAGKEISEEEANLVIPRSDINEAVELLEALSRKDAGGAIALVNKLVDDGVQMERFISDLIEIMRKLLLSKINPSLGERLGIDYGETIELKLNEILGKFEAGRMILIIEKLMDTRQKVKSSFIIQLPLELALADMCRDDIAVASKTQTRVNNTQQAAASRPDTPGQQGQASQPSAKGTRSVSAISKEVFMSRWNEFLAKIKKYNHSLSFVLRVCEPREVEGNKVCLAFKYKFHQDRIKEGEISALVKRTLSEVYGQELEFEAVLDENISDINNSGNGFGETKTKESEGTETGSPQKADAQSGSNNMMNDLLDTFGGKVVG